MIIWKVSDPTKKWIQIQSIEWTQFINGLSIQNEWMKSIKEQTNPKLFNNVIWECFWNGKQWTPIRERLDKKDCNNLFTYERTLQNIKENVQWIDLEPIFKLQMF